MALVHRHPSDSRRRRSVRAVRALHKRLRSERGTAVVEFALVLLPLALIVFGIMDFGRALNYYNDLTQLAGQGARALSVNQNPDGYAASAQFQTVLAAEADSPELKNPPVTVCITNPNGWPLKTGDPVEVVTSHDFRFIPLVHPVVITLRASSTERWEAPTVTDSTKTNISFSTSC